MKFGERKETYVSSYSHKLKYFSEVTKCLEKAGSSGRFLPALLATGLPSALGSRFLGQRTLKLAKDLLPSFPLCKGDEGETTGTAMIPRMEKDGMAFAEKTLQPALFSLWELVGHL